MEEKYKQLLFWNSLKTYLEVGLYQGVSLINLVPLKEIYQQITNTHDALLEEIKGMDGARERYPELFKVEGIKGA